MKKITAFTMAELLVTIIIIGVVSSTAFVSYRKVIEVSRYRNAKANLRTIYAGIELKKAKEGAYYLNSSSLSDINAKLGTDIVDNYFTYYASGGSVYAVRVGNTYGVELVFFNKALADNNPKCYWAKPNCPE